jgi:hypothetical protein
VLPPKPRAQLNILKVRHLAELDVQIDKDIGKVTTLNKAEFNQFIGDLKKRRKEFKEMNSALLNK